MLKNLVPPFLYNAYVESRRKYGYFGEYKTWQEAQSRCGSYDNEIILEKVKNSALKVKKGEAAYERDSVLFLKPQVSWHLLGPLLWIASKNNGSLKVLDFGGSLGSTYYQNKEFLKHLNLEWAIIEQPKFVEYGQKYFQDETLKFYKNISEYRQVPDVIVLGSVLQYLQSPYQILAELFQTGAKYILFDKTPFLDEHYDLITIQKVPPKIYAASYPSWIFDTNKFLTFVAEKYNLLQKLDSHTQDMFTFKNKKVNWKSFLFEKRD